MLARDTIEMNYPAGAFFGLPFAFRVRLNAVCPKCASNEVTVGRSDSRQLELRCPFCEFREVVPVEADALFVALAQRIAGVGS